MDLQKITNPTKLLLTLKNEDKIYNPKISTIHFENLILCNICKVHNKSREISSFFQY